MKEILCKVWLQIAHNPKTSLMGATTILSTLLPRYTVQIAAVATGLGLLLSKDGDTGASKSTERSDKVVKQVEELQLPEPPKGS